MGRDAAKAAQQQTTTDNTRSTDYNNRANYLFGQVTPYLQQNIKNPQGFTDKQMAGMETANNQSIGGSTAAALGLGSLAASRTGNVGSYGTAMRDTVRSGQETLSNNSLKIKSQDAMLRQEKQQASAGMLMGEGNANLQASMQALGLVNGSLDAWNQADQNTLMNWMGPINAMAEMSKAAAQAYANSGDKKS